MVKGYACYDKLWHLLSERKMLKKELKEKAGIGWSTVTKLGKNVNVEMDALVKICCALDCEISDIVTIVRSADRPEEDGVRSDMIVQGKKKLCAQEKM